MRLLLLPVFIACFLSGALAERRIADDERAALREQEALEVRVERKCARELELARGQVMSCEESWPRVREPGRPK